jgi:NhaP-type Na+/H+ or K+/H+ antiporter
MTSQAFNIGLAAAALTVLFVTMTNEWVRSRSLLSGPIICLVVGVVLGPVGFGVFTLDIASHDSHRHLVEQAARVTISLSVMSAALRLPEGWLRNHARSFLLVLFGGMALMWAGASGASLLVSGGSVLFALLVGGVITPTDPVLAGGIVQGRVAEEDIGEDTRHLLTAESGANDGLGLPFVLLPILFLTGGHEAPWQHFALHIIMWEVVAAAGIGLLLGYLTGKLFLLLDRRGATTLNMVTAVTLALTLAVVAGVRLMGADGILAVFAAGLAFDRLIREEHSERAEHFEEVVDRFFTLPVFILLGIALPVEGWLEEGWVLLLFVVAVLLLRRPLPFVILGKLVPLLKDRTTALFCGWFGPVGVAALFYALLAVERTGDDRIWTLVTAVSTASIILHGASATPLSKRYGRAQAGSARALGSQPR